MWLFIGFINGFNHTAVQQLTMFLSLIATVLVGYISFSNRLLNTERAKRLLYVVMFTKLIWKIIIEVLVISHLINFAAYTSIYNILFNATAVNLVIPTLNIFRINASNDALVFAILGFYLMDKKVSWLAKFVVLVLSGYFTLIVYSRVIFVQFFATVAYAFVISCLQKVGWRKLISCYLGAVVVLSACVYMSVSTQSLVGSGAYHQKTGISAALNDRFQGNDAKVSDEARTSQKHALLTEIYKRPLLGMGLGSYDRSMVRSPLNKFSYEQEYYAFFMQFGVVGFICIIVSTALMFYLMLNVNNIALRSVKWLILFNFLIWMAKPLFNPNFTSASSAAIIMALIAFSYVSSQSEEKHGADNKFFRFL